MSRPIQPSGTSTPSISLALGVGAELDVPRTRSTGRISSQSAVARPWPAPRAPASTPVVLEQRVADLHALRHEEAEAHRAADQDLVGDVEEAVDHPDLVGDLGAAEHDDQRPRRRLDHRAQFDHLALQQQAARSRAGSWRRPRSGVGAVRGAEGVVDVDVRRAPASEPASIGSFFVSPGSKRVFSSSTIFARPEAAGGACSTSAPTTFGACVTSTPSSSERRSPTGASRELRVEPCRPAARGAEARTSAAPRSRSSSSVGSAARIRVSSTTSPSFSGTLKSTRTRTRRPATGASRTLAFEERHLVAVSDRRRRGSEYLAGELDAAVRVAPLVVVPARSP